MTSLINQLEDITECSICTDVFVDPRTLPCLHTYCLHCIESCSPNKFPGLKNECPLCRQDFAVPEGGLSSLPKNFVIDKLKQIKALPEVQNVVKLCELCSSNASGISVVNQLATMICSDCCKEMCETCSTSHRNELSHRVVSRIEERLDASKLFSKPFSGCCSKHNGKSLKFFCFNCKTAICSSCITEEPHSQHRLSDINKAVDELRKLMVTDVGYLVDCVDICYQLKERVTDSRDAVVEQLQTIEREIVERAQSLTKEIEEQKNKLLREVEALRYKRTVEAEVVVQSIEGHREMAGAFKKIATDLMEYGSADMVAQQICYMHEKVNSLTKFDHLLTDLNKLGSVEISLSKPDIGRNNQLGVLLGKISIRHVDGASVDVRPISLTLINTLPAGSAVGGLATLGNRLFVARKGKGQQIEEYDLSKFSLQGFIRVPGLGNTPYAMASCTTNNCLYVIDHCLLLDDIYRVDLSETGSVSKWSGVGFNLQGLFVSSQHNVFVTSFGTIVEYSPNGVKLREVVGPADGMSSLRHTIQLNNGQFLVSGGIQHRVALLDVGGKLVASFDGRDTPFIGPLSNPCHMAIDKNGWIVVVDKNNHRLLALSPTLKSSRSLPIPTDGGGLRGPWTLCFDESHNRLIVGEWGGGRVLVYDYIHDTRFLQYDDLDLHLIV